MRIFKDNNTMSFSKGHNLKRQTKKNGAARPQSERISDSGSAADLKRIAQMRAQRWDA